jgi:hypothetical protein
VHHFSPRSETIRGFFCGPSSTGIGRKNAQEAQNRPSSSVGTLVQQFRRSGALDRPAINAILSKFLA